MLIVANVLTLVLIAAGEPKAPPPTTGASPFAITYTPIPTPGPKSDPNFSGNATSHAVVDGQEVWHLSLPDAIRIGLENSEVVRVIKLGGTEDRPSTDAGMVIARLNADSSIWNFKAAILAHVRSVEQQYWALSYHSIALWARETAVRIGGEIVAREKADLEGGRGTQANVAEAEQQLENFRLGLLTATSDLMTTERQLRNILGLPLADNRRIVPATAPTEAKVEPNWGECVIAMVAAQPELLQQRQLVDLSEVQVVLNEGNAKLADEERKAAKWQLERQQMLLRQVFQRTTHDLARFHTNVGTSYDQFRTAQRLRAASQNRLEAQRAFQQEGRITIDRLLDAVAQYANAITQEAEFKSTYNTALAALEEAKGTLLAHDRIEVIDGPAPRKPYVQAKASTTPKADAVAPASFQEPARPAPAEKAQASAKTYKLRAKLDGMRLLEVEVEVVPAFPVKP